MLTACLLMQGKTVDVITSTSLLAARNQKKFAPFLANFLATSGYLCPQNPDKRALQAQVRYGTNLSFEFNLLRNGMASRSLPRDDLVQAAIVDEVDNLLVDQGSCPAIISIPSLDPDRWIVEPILQIVRDAHSRSSLLPIDGKELRERLSRFRGGVYAERLRSINQADLERWVSSCRRALEDLQPNEDYVVCLDDSTDRSTGRPILQVVIVDKKNTGQLMVGSRWQDRCHQFLECKHGLDPAPESLTAAEIARPAFFSRYADLFGLTGTAGSPSERSELKRVYGLDCFDVPPHRTSLAQRLPLEICTGDEPAFFERLCHDIRRVCARGQPCLLLMESIASSNRFAQFADEKEIGYQLLNEMQSADSEFIIAQAGRTGTLTVATNTAGRGTDIVLSQQSLKAGGLHLIVGFYPENERVEAQAVGRAGRQGQPGSSKIIVHEEGPEGCSRPNKLAQRRAALVELTSLQRLAQAATSRQRWKEVSWFFAARAQAKEKLSTAYLDELARWHPPSGRLATADEKSYGAALVRLPQQRQAFFAAMDSAWGRAFALLSDSCDSLSVAESLTSLGDPGIALLAMTKDPQTAFVRRFLPSFPT